MIKLHKTIHMISWILLVVGGLNWGLAFFGHDLATWGLSMSILKVVYLLIGLSAIYEIFVHKHNCKMCNPNATGMR